MKNKPKVQFRLLLLIALGLSVTVTLLATTNAIPSSLTFPPVGGTNADAGLPARIEGSKTECRVKLEVTNNAGNVFIRTNKTFSLPIVLKNLSTNCTGLIYVGQTCNDSSVGFSCTVLDANGSNVTPIVSKPIWQTGWDETIKPMQSIVLKYDIGEVWRKAKAGEYTVTIEKQFTALKELGECCNGRQVISNPIRVKVPNDIE